MACRCCNKSGPCTTADDCYPGYYCCEGTCQSEPCNVSACGTDAASGGIQQTTQYYAVGAEGGTVVVHYNVGSLADRFQFYYGESATPFYDTGFITGTSNFSFSKDAGQTLIRVLSEGQDATTRWCYTLMCVNDNTTPPACNPFA